MQRIEIRKISGNKYIIILVVGTQGQSETWHHSLPHYVMLHLVYHWNKNPKRQ